MGVRPDVGGPSRAAGSGPGRAEGLVVNVDHVDLKAQVRGRGRLAQRPRPGLEPPGAELGV